MVRIENLKNDEGKTVGWPADTKAQDECLAVLLPTWRTELATAFRCASRLSEDEEKNLP